MSTRRTRDFETYTTSWSQRLWEKLKMVECFEGRTSHRAGDDCFTRAQSAGKLLLADSRVTDMYLWLEMGVSIVCLLVFSDGSHSDST